jgi:CRP-like cAMP-binding protein
MTRQGAEAHWLYLIVEGSAEVLVAVDAKTEHVAELKGGDYFGEMSMMTGAPRSSTVIAKTDVQTYRLAKDDFKDIVHRRPEIAVDIAQTLVQRQTELQMVKGEISEGIRKARTQESQGALLARIRMFFGLERE